MVDNAPDDYRRKLKKLSKREAQVLVLRCQGMNYAAIGKVLSIAVPTVKTDMGRIYVKLGLDVLERSVRHKVLYDTICPLLKVRKPAHEKEEKEPEDVVEGEEVTEEEEEIPIPEKVMEMVEYDGREIVPWHPESLVVVPPSPGRTGRRIWPVVLVLGVILGIFLGGGAVYLIFGPGKGSLPFVGPPTATVSPPTAFPSAIPSPLPSREVIPSNTPLQSTDTPVPPANTLAPTISIPPTVAGFLYDDFSKGLGFPWNTLSGQPIITNGALTATEDAWLQISDPSLQNFTVTLDMKPADCWFSGHYDEIGVRGDSPNSMIAFAWGACESAWGIVTAGQWQQVANSHWEGNNWDRATYRISVEGNKFTASSLGAYDTSFILPDQTMPGGNILLKVGRNSEVYSVRIVVNP